MSTIKIYTPEQEELILKMVAEGRSNSEIGAKLGVSRNAIAGKRGRMGLNNRQVIVEEDLIYASETLKEPWNPARDPRPAILELLNESLTS